jgi:LAS superfamily LD-carboxypeptidase LdcB
VSAALTTAQLVGRDESHLHELAEGVRLARPAAVAFQRLRVRAADAGFDLAAASAHRSFDRQLYIWNRKAAGIRPVFSDDGAEVDLQALSPSGRVHAILRYSALPGASRHHWGTDLDVFDAAAVGVDYCVRLSPDEVAAGGPFAPLHDWLDERMASGESEGFYRPYDVDRGGVATERWHLSYAPLARHCDERISAGVLRECWDRAVQPLLLRQVVELELEALIERYIAVAPDWCPEDLPGLA